MAQDPVLNNEGKGSMNHNGLQNLAVLQLTVSVSLLRDGVNTDRSKHIIK
jgi:hypothetical protein